MKIGDQVYHQKKGILTLTGKKYRMVGNVSVWLAKDSSGKTVQLDGTEIPLADHFDAVKSEEMARISQEKKSSAKKKAEFLAEEKERALLDGLAGKIDQSIKENSRPEVQYTALEKKLEEVKTAIESKDLTVGDTIVDMAGVIKALKRIESALPKEKDDIDYTSILENLPDYTKDLKKIISLLSSDDDKQELAKLQTLVDESAKSKDFAPIVGLLEMIAEKEITLPDFNFRDGRLLVEVDRTGGGGAIGGGGKSSDALSLYSSAGQDISSDPMYFSGLKENGSWYIKQMYLSGTYQTLYANGTSSYTTNWTNRTGLTYAEFNTLSW